MTATTPPSPRTITLVRDAMAQARQGNLPAARRMIDATSYRGPDEAMLRALAGMLACQAGDLAAGVDHLRRALALQPGDQATRANLVHALIDRGEPAEALLLCGRDDAERDGSDRLWRARAFLCQQEDDADAAIEAYRRLVALHPADFESWNNLGNLLTETEAFADACAALSRAAQLRPDQIEVRLNQALAVARAGQEHEAVPLFEACARDFPGDVRPLAEWGKLLGRLHRDDEAFAMLRRAAALAPEDPHVHVLLGQQYISAFDHRNAETAFRHAIRSDPSHGDAYLQLALLLELTNRVDDLPAVHDEAEAAGVEPAILGFIKALDQRRQGDFEQALASLISTPETVEPSRRAQMIGQCHDRLGRTHEAFAAFREMNRLSAQDPTDPLRRAGGYRDELRRNMRIVTPGWYAGWADRDVPTEPPSPVFILGFPRSGTTLLDTMLMGHPAVSVTEELPMRRRAEQALGDLSRLPSLSGEQIARARDIYFTAARDEGKWRPGTMLVDKLPMHMTKLPVIHRLFPDARIILALRHPCDVVWSCFSTIFRLNNAMACFLDLEGTARTYDLCFSYWEQCRSLLPANVRAVRYEQLVEDVSGTLKPVFDFIGLDWRDEVADHRRTAASREMIPTASYAQVTEPIYKRASGRWQRYRGVMEPVLPILAPWVERLGYSLE